MAAARRVLFKVLGPIVVIIGIFLVLSTLPEIFPDYAVVSDAIYKSTWTACASCWIGAPIRM